MDFVKNAASKLGGGGSSSSSSGDAPAATEGGGKYDKYIEKGVDYGEKQFMGTDTANKTDAVKKRDDQITSTISNGIDKYQQGSK